MLSEPLAINFLLGLLANWAGFVIANQPDKIVATSLDNGSDVGRVLGVDGVVDKRC